MFGFNCKQIAILTAVLFFLFCIYVANTMFFPKSAEKNLTCPGYDNYSLNKGLYNLDALVILGGERETYYRASEAYRIYKTIEEKTKNISLSIIISGNQSGAYGEQFNISDSEIIENFLINCSIPHERIIIEGESLDTLANFIYIMPILENINATEVAVITDDFHMPRALWLAKRVLGDSFNIYPFPSHRKAPFGKKVIENMIDIAQRIDLSISGIKKGDREAWVKYLREKHPFHAVKEGNKAPLSFYGTGIKIYGLFVLVYKEFN